MKIKLISHSQAPDFNESALDLVAYCARVSNPDNQNNKETSEKLVKYLMKHKHWSPLEMVSACLEIETTRDIARQILRHRSFSFQEFSQRYAVANSFTLREARIQDTKNRQNSHDNLDIKLERDWLNKQQDLVDKARELYDWALENKIAKEQARAVLPEGLTNSTLYMNGTLRSWIHYIDLRIANGTQKEHREVASKCLEQISRIFPAIQDN